MCVCVHECPLLCCPVHTVSEVAGMYHLHITVPPGGTTPQQLLLVGIGFSPQEYSRPGLACILH